MKNFLLSAGLLILYISFSRNASAQINTFPYTQGFETPFDTVAGDDFIPDWKGNEVHNYFARIFRDTVTFHTGASSLGMIPTSTFNPQVIVSFDLTGVNNMTANFWAKSETNGTGTRPTIVYFSTSIDGGLTYSPPRQIGDSTSFPSASTPWAQYFYPFPSSTGNQPNVKLKIDLSRGNGSGTTAKFYADDFTFLPSTVDSFPPYVISARATSINTVDVQFSEPVDLSAENTSNYTGLPAIGTAVRNGAQDLVTLTLSTPLVLGDLYTLNVANVNDQHSNPMNPAQNFTIVFNDNIGNVKITEIMYNNPGFDSLEFVEIKNLDASAINIGGWRFSEGLSGYFPSGITIQPNQYLVFAHYPMAIDTFFNISGTIGWDPTASLNNAGERVSISNSLDVLIDSVGYGVAPPWDSLANGWGYSLTLCNESADNDLPQNWSHSLDSVKYYGTTLIYATPGTGCITVGVEEMQAAVQKGLFIAPNPSSSVAEVSFIADNNQTKTIHISDMKGKDIERKTISCIKGINQFKINTVDYESGVYLLFMDGKATKLIVQH